MSPRTDPLTAPGVRGARRWLASEWGLSALALVLAVLIWAVVWGKIEKTLGPFEVTVEPVPHSPDRFVAFMADSRMQLELRGPQGSIEAARKALGSPAILRVSVPDIETDDAVVTLTRDDFDFPFSRRLLEGIEGNMRVRVFRWKDHRAEVGLPVLENVPAGFGYDIELTPPHVSIRAPADSVSLVVPIQPDPINVASLFSDAPPPLVPPPHVEQLTFNGWHDDQGMALLRKDVTVPPVRVEIRFSPKASETIRNQIQVQIKEGYVATAASEGLGDGEYFDGTFQGLQADLDLLRGDLGAWSYVVRVPDSALPADDEENSTHPLHIEWFLAEGLKDRRIRFNSPKFLWVITRK